MDTKLKKLLIPIEVLQQYSLSLLPYNDRIIGVMGRYMYIELEGMLQVPDADNDKDDIVFSGEVLHQAFILQVTISQFQKLCKQWIMGKKRICESYGHWCGAFGNIHIEEFQVIDTKKLTRFDESKDVDSDGFVYYEEVPVISVSRWSDYTDFEHG